MGKNIEQNPRVAYIRAKRYGTEIDEWVKKQAGNWNDPVVSTAEVAEAFDLDEDEAFERLDESERVHRKDVGDNCAVWW